MKDGKKEIYIRKLCSNCAYRAACKKRFSAHVVNGEVKCIDYAPDVEVVSRLKKEAEQEQAPEQD